MLKGLGTSEIKYYTALSSTAISAAGSSNAVDLSKFTHGTLIVSTGSTGAATITVDVMRSGTSNGTFQSFGASVSASVLGHLEVRAFTIGTSAVWHKTYRTATGGGSPAMVEVIAAAGARSTPINNEDSTRSYSVINA